VTIGTPNLGSPVADAFVNKTPFAALLPSLLTKIFERNFGALQDLTTEACAAFNETTKESSAIRRIAVAGDASQGGLELFFSHVAALVRHLTGEINDGLVTKTSALREGYTPLPPWPVDHAGEIGWFNPLLPFLPLPDYLAWYDQIVDML
jgi:hypothetical protein